MTASNPLCFPFAFPHCLARLFELLLMFIPPPGWKWQPTRVQQTILHRQNPREHHCWWVTLYIWGYSLVARMHFLDCTTNTALKHSKQLKHCVQHIQLPLTWIALLLAYSTNSFAFLGVCFFMFLFYLRPLASTVLFVLILHNVFKCSARMQDIDYSRQNHWLLYSFSCMHSEDSFIPDNRLVSSR